MLELYVDSAQIDDVRPLLASGLFAGVTTNPTLLRRAGVGRDDLPRLAADLRQAGAQTVFVQTWGADTAELLDHAAWLRAECGPVGIKVPVTPAGLVAIRELATDGVPTLATAVYHRAQILPAIASGAAFVAPYVGRMTDHGLDGVAEVLAMQQVIERTGASTRLLVASLRSREDAAKLAAGGVPAFTVSPAAWAEITHEQLTTEAVDVFEEDMRSLL